MNDDLTRKYRIHNHGRHHWEPVALHATTAIGALALGLMIWKAAGL